MSWIIFSIAVVLFVVICFYSYKNGELEAEIRILRLIDESDILEKAKKMDTKNDGLVYLDSIGRIVGFFK